MARTTRSAPIGRPTSDASRGRYVGRRRNYSNLAADIEDFVEVCDKRMVALMRQSLSDVIDNAQLAAGKGGRMRVNTGFLRASGQASLTGMPTGPIRGELTEPGAYRSVDKYSDTVKVALLIGEHSGGMKLGDTFYFGWTAAYAQYRELFDGFLEGALQHWHRIVAFNTDTIRERIKQ